jgi:hypothetical protein
MKSPQQGRLHEYIGEAFRRVGDRELCGRHGQAALSGSKPKAPGFAGGYLLGSFADPIFAAFARLNYSAIVLVKMGGAHGA